ncbi:MAG TPA: hypothetical protein H9717_14655 [Candidatus Eisenbergiella merdipullorum]|uniref:Pyruvate kinase n=1 Tax=Candidatus Eisenbergiella merdipullorum TaxID=2838553 RepID=A0A9D2I9Q2_9FIRM|nr:hypothetical protein [Candidatus Eisenbergiella merdipullorum]
MLENYLQYLREIKPRKVVLSFAEDIGTLNEISGCIKNLLPHVEIIPKIETQTGVDNCKNIMESFKTIMLGRGDLALFSEISSFGYNQNYVLDMGEKNNANVIVATDILTSLYENMIPARGDLTDIYYLKGKKVKDIVVSAGISIQPELFGRFCNLVEDDFK